jgi:acetyl-CoA C-acetyltransferase
VRSRRRIDDAGLTGQDVDAVFAGNAMVHSSQVPGTYTQLSKWTGTQFKSGVHFEAECSTTNVGAALAAMSIAAGVYDTVLVYGLETTRTKVKGYSPYEREPISNQQTWLWTDMAVNQAYGVPQGYDIFSTYNGLVALGYCRKHGMSIEDFDRGMFELCRTRRLHGAMNRKANIQEKLEDRAAREGFSDPYAYWQSDTHNPFASWPSRLLSLVTTADGASAMVITRAAGQGRQVTASGVQGIRRQLQRSAMVWRRSDLLGVRQTRRRFRVRHGRYQGCRYRLSSHP